MAYGVVQAATKHSGYKYQVLPECYQELSNLEGVSRLAIRLPRLLTLLGGRYPIDFFPWACYFLASSSAPGRGGLAFGFENVKPKLRLQSQANEHSWDHRYIYIAAKEPEFDRAERRFPRALT